MDHKGRLRRLDQLYADIDLPALNPAGHPLEVSQAPENLPIPREGESLDVILLPQIEPFDMAVPDGVEEALPLLPDPGPAPGEAAVPNPAAELLDVAALPMVAEPAPPLVTSETRMDAKTPVAESALRLSKTEVPRLADWKAALIGVLTGSLVSGIILLLTSQMNIFSHPGRLVLWSGEMFLGMVGALLANSWKSTTRELWRAALTWTLYPVWFALLIGLIYLLLTFTSLNG